ncbi:hypothetical protein B7P43_G11866 [Cryptotermes secundus]|uniref:Uncharacterized protein n=2 Tax=Cryptotermes secundus TaxID=105785 RepID=A0A2J7QKR0_9NEOP|nr:uncharacterized protein LOC111866896 isoform X2 [Cryptotermes secundus]PNF29174.1 hypothetical protein B7P43_G11866 [Cryptotermes secundus]
MLLILLMMLGPLTAANSTKPLPVMKHQMCSDLCTSGLGGAPCGELCSEDLGFDLQSRVRQYTVTVPRKKEIYGPRRTVCPLLCRSNLGEPLCGCHVESALVMKPVNWTAICDSFCLLEGYTLYGCPRCSVLKPHKARLSMASDATRGNSQDVDWADLCAYLCSIGEGGAACNCDAVP